MTLFELTRPLRSGLAGLRARAKALLLVLGVARTTVYVAAVLGLYFLADYALRLPLGARRVVLAGAVIGFALVVVRRLVRPLQTRLDDGALAARVEAAHPELLDRLSSSLAFGRAADDPDNEDSPDLMRAVVEETAALADRIPFRRVAKGAVAGRWAAGAAVLAAVLAGAALARPALAGIFVDRGLLLRDTPWPRRTTLSVVGLAPGAVRRVTQGREATLQIRAEGAVPPYVQLRYWETDADTRVVETVDLSPAAEDGRLFAFTFHVRTSYTFTVTGGDDDRALAYGIEALTPPTVLDIAMECTYPPYLQRLPAVLEGGDQRVPEGTEIRLRVKTNMPLRSAHLLIDGNPLEPLQEVAPAEFTSVLAAKRDVRYSLRLVGQNGEENDPGVDTYVLRVTKDRPPTLRIHTPNTRTERREQGAVLVQLTARDDHRIAAVRFHYRVGDGAERVLRLGAEPADGVRLRAAEGTDPALTQVLATIDLPKLRDDEGRPPARGTTARYWFEAEDTAGHAQRTKGESQIEVVSDDELAQGLEARQIEMREAVERAAERARNADLDALPAIDDDTERRRWIGRAQAAQARVVDDLDALSRQTQGMLNRYVFNRLDDLSSADQVLPYFERHLLEPRSGSGQPFRGALYRALHEAVEQRAVRAGDAYLKLIEMAALADRLAADHGPAVYRALGDASRRGRTAQQIETALRAARAEQEQVRNGLARLSQLMREWQSYEGVVRFFRSLRDKEDSVVNHLEDLGQETSEK